MKLNRAMLRHMIHEEIENFDYKRTKNVSGSPIEYDAPGDAERYEDSWAGGDNIHVNADHLKDYGSKEKSVLGLERLKQDANINETRSFTIQQIKAAAYELQTDDPGQIATYLGAHEDEVYEQIQADNRASGLSMNLAIEQQSSDRISPAEYTLTDIIAQGWEKRTLQNQYDGTGPTWPQEVDRAAAELEEALTDSGVTINIAPDILKLIEAIEEKLHNGEYAMQRDF